MILSRKKLKFQKRAKRGHFPKGLVHGFCPKIEIFLFAFFTEVLSENNVFDIVERKE